MELLSDVLRLDATERVIVPENPLRLVKVTVDEPGDPLDIDRDDGLAEMLKSPLLTVPTLTVTVA